MNRTWRQTARLGGLHCSGKCAKYGDKGKGHKRLIQIVDNTPATNHNQIGIQFT